MLTEEQITAYLERIGYNGSREPTLSTLASLQKAHLYTIPYETLDIVHQKPISLEVDHIFEKIVFRKRGGYCFELNELYAQLLLSLGFCVTRHFSRFLKGTVGIPKPRHLLLIVHLPEGDYISDVGTAAASPMEPILICDKVQQLPLNSWVILDLPDYGMTLCQVSEEGNVPFCTIPSDSCFPQDIEPTHFYCCQHPASFFRENIILGLRIPNGAYMLRQGVFSIIDGNTISKETVTDEKRLTEICHQYFHIYE